MAAHIDRPSLDEALALLGLDLPAGARDQLEAYAALVAVANQRMNLTRITDPLGVAVEHMADSVACLLAADPDGTATGIRLVDVGSGAGFPGLVLKIARPSWFVTLVESVGKKARFLEETATSLGLAGVEVLPLRAEEVGRLPGHREAYDIAIARAVARLPVLAEYLLPLVKVGGVAIAMRGAQAEADIAEASPAAGVLGGRFDAPIGYRLPGFEAPRYLVVARKLRPAPAAYPRRPGLPAQRPLDGC